MAKSPSVVHFPTTCWSRILAAVDPADPAARDALADLCSAYWYPVYAFIRGRSHDPDEAADLTQGFFVRLLDKGLLAAADPEKGRFRTLILADCSRFLADHRDRQLAHKRGGGRVAVSIDATDAEGRYRHEPVHNLTPERLFERAWAVTLLGQALERLRLEYEASQQGAAFDQLKMVLEAQTTMRRLMRNWPRAWG